MTPPDRQETNVSWPSHVKPSTVLTTGGGHQMTPPDRQAPTSYNKGSSRNKCFLTTGGGSPNDPPWSSRFCPKWYLHHCKQSQMMKKFSPGKWQLWSETCSLASLVSLKPWPFRKFIAFSFAFFWGELICWNVSSLRCWWGNFFTHIFFSLDFSEVS